MSARTCRACSAPITRHSRSGLCRPCWFADPEEQARRIAALRAAFAHRPELAEANRRRMAAMNRTPEARARSARNVRRDRLWERSLAAITPESRRKRGETIRQRNLADIPPALREEFLRLRSMGFSKAEAKQIVLDHHQARSGRASA